MAAKDKANKPSKDSRDRVSTDLRHGLRERIEALQQRVDVFRQITFAQVVRTLLVRGVESFEQQYPAPAPAITIASLISQWDLGELSERTRLSQEALARLQDGIRPTNSELVDLATTLIKTNGEPWTTHELLALREAAFQQPTKEKQPNGNGK